MNTLTVDGTAHISEQAVAETGAEVGPSLLSDLPLTFVNTQTAPGSTSSATLTFADVASGDPATITRTGGSWITDGFLPGDRIAVSGAGSDDGIYVVSSAAGSVTPTVLTLAAGSNPASGSATGASVLAEVHQEPIVQAITASDPNGPLMIWSVVLGENGSIITDQVQEWGSQEYGVQEKDGSGNLLYYDSEGQQTTDPSTGIPVIMQESAGTPGACKVYFNSAGQEVFTSGGQPVYVADFVNGVPLYVDPMGNVTTTVTNMPFMIPVNRTQAVPWTALTASQVTVQGTNTLTLDDSADPKALTGSLATTVVPVNQLVDGQPVYDGGAVLARRPVLLRRRAGHRSVHASAARLLRWRAGSQLAHRRDRDRSVRQPPASQGRRPGPALCRRPGDPRGWGYRAVPGRRARPRRERQSRR